jgi:hypothetical protein
MKAGKAGTTIASEWSSALRITPNDSARVHAPGDVNGLSRDAIEALPAAIYMTDAEGRLILGDAMTYAERLGATHIVDVATLTGAVSRAFGHLITGAFGTPQSWWDDVMTCRLQFGRLDGSERVAKPPSEPWVRGVWFAMERAVATSPRSLGADLARARELRPLYESVDYLLDLHSMTDRCPPLAMADTKQMPPRCWGWVETSSPCLSN